MNWTIKNKVHILEEDNNYEVVASPMYVGMYAAYFQGKLLDSFCSVDGAKTHAEKHYNQKELDRDRKS